MGKNIQRFFYKIILIEKIANFDPICTVTEVEKDLYSAKYL